jgi:peptidoglycan/xylan/chitin deacetylase (PgdA/CDA1 family)
MRKTTLLALFLFIETLFADAHIFVLHRFDDTRYPSTSISSEQLIADFEYIKAFGYRVVTLDEIVERVESGKDVPDNWVSFTIDDGYKSFYENGLKIFKEYGYPFTLFLYTESIDKGYPDFMSWDNVREIQEGNELGVHSHKHPHLTKLSPLEIMKDTQASIESYKENLNRLPNYYAYPYGEYDKNSKEIIQAFGFKAVLNQTTGAVNRDSDVYNLNRIALLGKHNIAHSLQIRHLKAEWLYPNRYPANSLLDRVEVRVPKGVEKVQLYISGHGWQWLNVREDGFLQHKFKKPIELKMSRTRLFLKSKDNRWNGHIIVK